VSRIRDVYPGSRIRLFSIPDPGSEFFNPGSRIRIKEFKYFNQKELFLSSRKYDWVVHPGYGSLLFNHPGSRIQGQKGTGSRIRNTDFQNRFIWTRSGVGRQVPYYRYCNVIRGYISSLTWECFRVNLSRDWIQKSLTGSAFTTGAYLSFRYGRVINKP
jgi:hypothetical protein